jgi:Tol biopolymer transport system component
MRTASPLTRSILTLLVTACATDPAPTEPELKSTSAATTLTASPARLSFALPSAATATLTARVQYVGTITATSSDATGCARVSPSSVPATKPAGSSVYVATFTVTPVAVGACTVTMQDKKGKQVVVPVTVEGGISAGRIVYSSNRDGNLEIYLMGAAGSARLTNNPAADFDPVLSPDGTKIAFVSNRDGPGNIYVMNADGSNPVRLTAHGGGDIEPAFAPDGRIVFASYQVDYEATRPELVTDLWIMNGDGSGQARLTTFDHSLGASAPRVSPDGTRIVFILGWQIWSIGIDGTDPVALMTEEDNFSASFSPDGSKIVFASDVNSSYGDVWVMHADGSSPQRLTSSNSGAGTPTFSPDGSKIVFASSRNGNDDLYLINADGSDEVRLTADPGLDLTPRFGP